MFNHSQKLLRFAAFLVGVNALAISFQVGNVPALNPLQTGIYAVVGVLMLLLAIVND